MIISQPWITRAVRWGGGIISDNNSSICAHVVELFFLFVELTPTKKLDKLFISLLPRKSVRVVQCFWQLDLIVFHVIDDPK
jgi:hypothetical protein